LVLLAAGAASAAPQSTRLRPGGSAASSGAQERPLGPEAFVNWETPHVHPLDLTPDGSRLLAVNTADARLEVFDLSGAFPQRVASIPVGLDPVSVRARTNDEAWVVNHVSDSVSVVDLATANVVVTMPTEDEPTDVVFAGTPERAFVSCSQADSVLVFDPAAPLVAPSRVPIQGEDPRAMAVSADGTTVYVAVFESGNRSTILAGGGTMVNLFPPNVVSDPAGPHGGVNPPPNDGAGFEPPINPALPAPPAVGLVVKQDGGGSWLDDTGGDWTSLVSGPQAALSGRPVGWQLLDHDVAILDANTLAVSYADHLMNLCMALAVHPSSGEVVVVGSDATNEVRFEPNLSGRFTRWNLARVDPAGPSVLDVVDLNPHLDYATGTVDASLRDQSVADVRGIAWDATGAKAYVTGMGTDNLIVVDASGQRAGITPTIEVGRGPTGVVFDGARSRVYVLNKFSASVSIVDVATETELHELSFFDPTPRAIRVGRKHLYDARLTSGLGITACAACHVDARMDRLAWDLGNPAGSMDPVAGQNLGAGVPGLNTDFEDFHPMKGPMMTQTLQDIIGKEPHHWRGDRDGIEQFNPAFVGLLGDDQLLTAAEMQEFEDFLATIHFPPNPFRNLDNSLPSDLALPRHHRTGRFGNAGMPLPNGNALTGLQRYRPPVLLDDGNLACSSCHSMPTGIGTNYRFNGFFNPMVPIPPGPNGELHHALVSQDGSTNVSMKIPQLRNLHEKVGADFTQTTNVAGFGFLHDGSIDSIERFVSEPIFDVTSDQDVANLVAFLLSFSGSDLPTGSPNNLLEPPGTLGQDTHAAVGRQLTLRNPVPSAADVTLLNTMLALADAGEVGLVVKGRQSGLARGWAYLGGGVFQSDRSAETATSVALATAGAAGSELTFTVVPEGTEIRIGIDRDRDGELDRDELDSGGDPADPAR